MGVEGAGEWGLQTLQEAAGVAAPTESRVGAIGAARRSPAAAEHAPMAPASRVRPRDRWPDAAAGPSRDATGAGAGAGAVSDAAGAAVWDAVPIAEYPGRPALLVARGGPAAGAHRVRGDDGQLYEARPAAPRRAPLRDEAGPGAEMRG